LADTNLDTVMVQAEHLSRLFNDPEYQNYNWWICNKWSDVRNGSLHGEKCLMQHFTFVEWSSRQSTHEHVIWCGRWCASQSHRFDVSCAVCH
jgi:hypothetical protein